MTIATQDTAGQDRSIDGKGKTIKDILFARKFSIDYYQREYKWQRKQLEELISDLADVFLTDYRPGQERRAVAGYNHYFLGSIIISKKNGQDFIIDGQQRLRSALLLGSRLTPRAVDCCRSGGGIGLPAS